MKFNKARLLFFHLYRFAYQIVKPDFIGIKILAVLLLLSMSYASEAQTVREKGNLVLEGIPEIPDSISARLQQYQRTRSASLQGWLPNGNGIVILTRFGETRQLHHVERPGGARRQLSFFEEPINSATVSPNPTVDRILYTRDEGGSEFYQIYSFNRSTGEHQMLTDGKGRNGSMLWSNDGKKFVYHTTKRNGRDFDLHIMKIGDPGNSKQVLKQGGLWIPTDWSSNDKKLYAIHFITVDNRQPYIVDLASDTLIPFRTSNKELTFESGMFSANDEGIYYISNESSEFQRLRYHDLSSGKAKTVTPDISWNVESFNLSKDGRYLAYVVNRGGMSELHILDTKIMEELSLSKIPAGIIEDLSFSPASQELGFVLTTPKNPGDVYSINLDNNELTRWTYSEVGGLNTNNFVTPKLIKYETFDKIEGKPREIPAFIYRPKGSGPYPVLIDIHGGPEGQARPDFSPVIQYLVNEMGIAVIEPNVRGSTGYGKDYLDLDNGVKREGAVRDIGSLLDWIAQQKYLDENKVAVMGGSYGGYMALASMIHYGDRLRACIDIVGISNFVTFLENTEAYRRDYRRPEYGDEREPEMRAFLKKISPTTNADKINKPLFVAQGLNDPRVPVSESEQMVSKVRENDTTVWYMLAKDEGHGFKKQSNKEYFYGAAVLFLDKFY